MRCPICNKVNESGTKFCVNCGQDIFKNLTEEKEDTKIKDDSHKRTRSKILKLVKISWHFINGNWILILILIFSYQAMVNSGEARRFARNAEDYAAEASDYSRKASLYSEDSADSAADAAEYAEQAANDAAYIRRWSY
jgi:uncharacterized membrane protein YvbJ